MEKRNVELSKEVGVNELVESHNIPSTEKNNVNVADLQESHDDKTIKNIDKMLKNYMTIIKNCNDFLDIKSMIKQIETHNLDYDDSLLYIKVTKKKFELFVELYNLIKSKGFIPSFIFKEMYFDHFGKN